jgi:hypothetical protein
MLCGVGEAVVRPDSRLQSELVRWLWMSWQVAMPRSNILYIVTECAQ